MRTKWRAIGGVLLLGILVFGAVGWAANGDITVNIQGMAGNSLSAGSNVKADLWGQYWNGSAYQWFHMVENADAGGSVTWTAGQVDIATAGSDYVYYYVTVWGGDPFANSQVSGTAGGWILYDSSAAAKNWNVRTFTTSIEGTASPSDIVFDVDLGGTVPNDSAVAVNISYEECDHDVQPVISATTKSNMQADGYTFSFASGPGLLTIQKPGTSYNETFSARVDGADYIAELETEALLSGVYDDVAKEFSADIDYHSIGLSYGDTFFALCYFYFTGPEAGLEVCTHNGYVGHMLHPMIVPRPSQVWVDDDYTSGSCGGHNWGYDAFDNIQDGIDAAAESGTVNANTGTYYEDVAIDKTLTLQASSSPVIDGGGSGTAVTIDASNVYVTGFTIQNAVTGVLVSSGTGNKLHFNNIINNTTWAVNNTSGNLVDAENNYWGDGSGPSGEGSGTGDAVSTNVDFDPWTGMSTETVVFDADVGQGETVENATAGVGVTLDDATGTTDITVAEYTSPPPDTPSFGAGATYVDVQLSNPSGVQKLTITFEGMTAETVIYFYLPGTGWIACSNQTYASGTITVTVTDSTVPTLAQLTGTIFAEGAALGNVNGDDVIDVLDVRLCLQIATGFIEGTGAQQAAADVDQDGDVDLTDAQILAEYIIGIRTALPGGGPV